jgi:hypothetical protein
VAEPKSFIEEARARLAEHLPSLKSDDEFSAPVEDVQFKEAAGKPVREPRQVSRPFYFSVTNFRHRLPVYTPVFLFNAAVNLTTANFGNSGVIRIASLLPNITYGGLLSVTINQPFKLDQIKTESQYTDPLFQPIAFTETQYTGEGNTVSYVPNTPLDQIYSPNGIGSSGASVTAVDEIIHSSIQISFLSLNLTSINYKIYPKYITDYSKALEHKKLIKDFKKAHVTILPGRRKIYY